MARATLVSIPGSNFVEKARWALQLAQISFVEEKHAPILVYKSTKPKGGRSVPLLVTSDGSILTDSRDILDFCAKERPSLYPTPRTRELEEWLDEHLGPHTRRVAYHIFLPDDQIAKKILFDDISPSSTSLDSDETFEWLRKALQKGLNITAKSTERSYAKIEEVVAKVEELLGDKPIGEQFLDGDTFSAADITFCAHMSLLLLPPQHAYLCTLHVQDFKNQYYRERLLRLQQSKAAEFVYYCYEHERPHMHPSSNL